MGIEPTTFSLRVRCSAIEPHQHFHIDLGHSTPKSAICQASEACGDNFCNIPDFAKNSSQSPPFFVSCDTGGRESTRSAKVHPIFRGRHGRSYTAPFLLIHPPLSAILRAVDLGQPALHHPAVIRLPHVNASGHGQDSILRRGDDPREIGRAHV